MTSEGNRPSVLFVCVHNAGRSQMAAGFVAALGGEAVRPIRDEIRARVEALIAELTGASTP